MGTWGLPGGPGRVYRHRNRAFICAVVRDALFFLVYCKERTDAGKCIEAIAVRHGAGGEYHNHFVLIGCLTASWRVGGTIPFILYYSVDLIEPRYFVLCTFLLCCMMSFLTGTSFGTSSTMGVICMMISNAAGLNPMLTAGAVLSGIFSGTAVHRCLQAQYLFIPLPGQIFTGISGE